MDLLVNDLSFHGQLTSLKSFRDAIARLMGIRQIVRRHGRELHCHRKILHAQVARDLSMQQAVQSLSQNERLALLQWLTQHGPFWEDTRNHTGDDWLEFQGDIVTDTAVGEVAFCCLNGIDRALVSLTPSNWEFSPVRVECVWDSNTRASVEILNYWDAPTVDASLQIKRAPLRSWGELERLATVQYTQLTFAADTFAPIRGYPFVPSAAQRILFILKTLDRLKSCVDDQGQRTPEGHELYQNFFTGRKGNGGRGALFSDSSEREKEKFGSKMTFDHPTDRSKSLFCPWHGKVQTPQLRVHFSWPIQADKPLYIVYVGPKLTKR